MSKTLRVILIEAARLAGEVHKDVLGKKSFDLKNKYEGDTASDVVTIADIQSEEVLRDYFLKNLPDFNIMGEEKGAVYNGNGKVIIIDPLDCTKGFREGLDNFGPIIGVYNNGINIGGVEYNVLKDIMYIATDSTGFERLGSKEVVPTGAILVESYMTHCPSFNDLMEKLIKKEFPGHQVIKQMPSVINKSRVCDGKFAAYFHSGLARHDIAAIPILGKTTGTFVTDYRGRPYEPVNAEKELDKYNTEEKLEIYSNPILVAHPLFYKGMLKVLKNFEKELDQVSNP